jgi:hypothetical protein
MAGQIEHVAIGNFPGANGKILDPAEDPPPDDPDHKHQAWAVRGSVPKPYKAKDNGSADPKPVNDQPESDRHRSRQN